MRYLTVGILSAALTVLWAQNSQLTPRQLYFGAARAAKEEAGKSGSTQAKGGQQNQAKAKQNETPNQTQAKAKQNNDTKSKQAPNNGSNSGKATPVKPSDSPSGQSGTQTVLAAERPDRLGLRYNLLKVDPKTGKTTEVDPDQNFTPGDCFAVRLRPNRAGRIYVFNKASSGRWQVLLPSAEMPDERNDYQAGRNLTVPRGYCFGLDDPPGVDTLMVAMTDRTDDIQKLDNYVRASDTGATPEPAKPAPKAPAAKQGGAPLMMAGLGYDAVVSVTKVIDQGPQMISRDVVIQKISNPEPEYSEEPANSVYIVKTAATDQDRLVIEIPIRHESER